MLEQHYADDELIVLKKAVRDNEYYYKAFKAEYFCTQSEHIEFFISQISSSTVYYGAGRNMAECLEYCKKMI